MLTGDKLETATCIAKSSRLVARTQAIHIFKTVSTRSEAHQELNAFRRKQGRSSYQIPFSVIIFELPPSYGTYYARTNFTLPTFL